ncbi:MAG: phenylalanine--tRNA ligase subunit beta, partial [Clostridia bacterium]|nr:phenylalanine--tRNA ligase subunit beta [Clostridia bacterium]
DDMAVVIGADDRIVEFEITPNRPDCLSMLGLALEASATFDLPLNRHTPVVKGGHGSASELLNVSIEAPDLCPIYSAKIVKNVRVKPSPRWLRERLRAMGVRPINNIVDITNYVMMEYGQPMHAFDLRFIQDGKIIVRRAVNGETITTLDGVDRTLTDKQLVIADAAKPVAIAGVMGGEYSGIMDDTTTIVFESACFNGASVRTTARDQGMRTDASARYEKGLDPNNCLPALERACELVELLDAGDVMDDVIVCDHSDSTKRRITFNADWINHFLGTDLTEDYMRTALEKLDFTFDGDEIIVPTNRSDVEHKADIAEEVARMYGYNKIPCTQISGGAQGKFTDEQKFVNKVNTTMLALGLSEIMTYSFISPKYYDKIRMPADSPLRNSLVISNPLGEDTSIMRTTALPSMLEILSKNYNNRNMNVRLFEVCNEYLPRTADELPEEKRVLMMGMYGDKMDFFALKGMIEELLTVLDVTGYDVAAVKNETAYHPGRCAELTANGKRFALLGEIHPLVAENYGIEQRVYAARLDMAALYELSNKNKMYHPLPKFPAVTRDLALLCDKTIPVLTLEKAIRRGIGATLESVKLFDVYEGSQIPAGQKSVAFNITLRSADHTLSDDEINRIMNKIMKNLTAAGAVLRS